MCENLPLYESVYFKELHNEQECYWPTIYRAGAAVMSTITSFIIMGGETYTPKHINLESKQNKISTNAAYF